MSMLTPKDGRGKRATCKPMQPSDMKAQDRKVAGIDIGAETHYVAVPADSSDEPVRSFGCFTADLHQMAGWLRDCGVESVAMESTGVYWIPVYEVLEQYGFELSLVDARQVSNVPGRKTDVLDCQWIQQLHTFGLLRGCFRPTGDVVVLRAYWRQRLHLVESASRQILLMQKALEQMNVQLHKVLSDITGVTGTAIIRAIVGGERRPQALAAMRQRGVKNDEATIAKALTGTWREEHLFALKQALELFDIYHEKIRECDEKIEEQMSRFAPKSDPKDLPKKPGGSSRRKNQPHFDVREELYRMTGVDLTRIDGIDELTALTVICESGTDVTNFATEKHYSSWLGLCPNNRITGGKIKKRRTRDVQNRAAQSLRLAAQSLHHNKSALGAYYRRMAARVGVSKAITATAHKLAILIYRMLKYGMDYTDQGQQYYEERYRERVLKALDKHAATLGYQLVPLQEGGVS